METFLWAVSTVSWGLLALLMIRISVFGTLSMLHVRQDKKGKTSHDSSYKPLVSVIIPCFNEEKVLENCVYSLTKQKYKNFEILIVDDGSSDSTYSIAKKLAGNHNNIAVLTQANSGKAQALNYGISQSKGEIVVSLDADSIFIPTTLENIVSSFIDPTVSAIGGNVKVANRQGLLGKHQAIEYINGLNTQRRAFATLGCVQVIPGAIGAFRRKSLLDVGGYSSDTLTEDMDLTISLVRSGHKVEYNSQAVAYTEAPTEIRDFIKQRHRWSLGVLQVLKKHRDVMFNSKYGALGVVGLPFFSIFPWIDVFTSILFVITLTATVITHGVLHLVVLYTILSFIQFIITFTAINIDREDKKLLFIPCMDILWYYHLLNFATVKAAISNAFKLKPSWQKVPRLGQNILPATSASI